MDTRLSISKKLRSGECGTDGTIFKITEYKKDDDIFPVLYILNEYWKSVNSEDLSEWIDVEVKGIKVRIQKIEMQLYRYVNEGCKIFTIMTQNGTMLGVAIGVFAFTGILCIRGLYVIPEARRLCLANHLVNCFGNVDNLMFQTRKENPPELMFKALKFTPSKIIESDKLITWTVKWENNYEHT